MLLHVSTLCSLELRQSIIHLVVDPVIRYLLVFKCSFFHAFHLNINYVYRLSVNIRCNTSNNKSSNRRRQRSNKNTYTDSAAHLNKCLAPPEVEHNPTRSSFDTVLLCCGSHSDKIVIHKCTRIVCGYLNSITKYECAQGKTKAPYSSDYLIAVELLLTYVHLLCIQLDDCNADDTLLRCSRTIHGLPLSVCSY